MPEYLSLGVYVEEIEMGAKPIEGVSTSTAGFLGETERGPTKPALVTSWLGYKRIFGNYFGANKYLPYAVEGFFINGGQRCYIGRIVKSTATSASIKLNADGDVAALTATAVGEGSWGSRIAVKVTNNDNKTFRLLVFYWRNWKEVPATLYDPEIDTKTLPRPLIEIFDNLSLDESSPTYYEKKVNSTSNFIRLSKKADDSGEVPRNWLKFLEGGFDAVEYTGFAKKIASNPDLRIDLGTKASADKDYYKDMKIEIVGGSGEGQRRKITAYDEATNIATVDEKWTTIPDDTSEYCISNPAPKLTASDYTRTDISTPGQKKV